MSVYFVANLTIHDPATYEKYLEGFDEVFERYQGEVIAVDEKPEVLEGSFGGSRVVLIRFPSTAALHAWYDSPEYRRLREVRHRASTGDVLVVEAYS